MPPVDFEKLRDRRAELDLSNADLAKQLGISLKYVTNVMGGTNHPSDRLIHRLARVLQLPVGQVRRKPQGDPTEPPEQPPNEPKAPPSRRGKDDDTRPPRPTETESRLIP